MSEQETTEQAPDANCFVLPDGSCASVRPCVHWTPRGRTLYETLRLAAGQAAREQCAGETLADLVGLFGQTSVDEIVATEAAIILDHLWPAVLVLLGGAHEAGFKEGFDLAHEPAACGHARANWKDPAWGTPAYEGREQCEACREVGEVKQVLFNLHSAVEYLGTVGREGKTYFEASPTTDPACHAAWVALNNAQVAARVLFTGQRDAPPEQIREMLRRKA